MNQDGSKYIFSDYLIRLLLLLTSILYGQSLEVTFRYVAGPNDDFTRVFVPGTMPSGTSNDWGPNSNGVISPSAPSRMVYSQTTDSYEKTYSLNVGDEHQYKIHFHHNSSGSDYTWIPDPLNPLTTDDNWTNSILEVTDPLLFQEARHLNNTGEVTGFSMGIFASENVDSIRYAIGVTLFLGQSIIMVMVCCIFLSIHLCLFMILSGYRHL